MSDQTQGGELQRPGAATTFGILSIIFAGFSLIFTGLIGAIGAFTARAVRASGGIFGALAEADPEAAEAMGEAANMFRDAMGASAQTVFLSTLIFSVLAIVVAAVQLAAGVGLLKGGEKTLNINKIYAFAAIGLAVVRVVVNLVLGIPVGWFGNIIGLAYPILILTLVVGNQTVQEWVAKKNA